MVTPGLPTVHLLEFIPMVFTMIPNSDKKIFRDNKGNDNFGLLDARLYILLPHFSTA